MLKKASCKICRRLGQKVFLKGEKCLSPKCPFIKRPYAPGPKKKRTTGHLSEYGKQLREKQKIKFYYGLRETQFKNYVKDILKKRSKMSDSTQTLLKKLERRLDNVIFRLGFARSRAQARQMVSHSYFLVDGKPVNIPSFLVKPNMVISFKESKKTKTLIKNLSSLLKNYQPPQWLRLDKEKMEGHILSEPDASEMQDSDISAVFEFYAK